MVQHTADIAPERQPVLAIYSPPDRIGPVGLFTLAIMAVAIACDGAHRRRWLVLVIATGASSVVHVGAMAAASRLAGVARERVALFLGGAILRWFDGATWWCIGWLPGGGYVKFPAKADELRGPGAPWDAVAPPAKALVSASGCAALFVASVLLLGWPAARAAITSAPGQITAIASIAGRASIGRSVVELLDTPSLAVVVGVVFAKVVVWNLIPLPIFNGGQILIYLIEWVTRRRAPARWLTLSAMVSLAAVLVVFTAFVLAVGRAWRG